MNFGAKMKIHLMSMSLVKFFLNLMGFINTYGALVFICCVAITVTKFSDFENDIHRQFGDSALKELNPKSDSTDCKTYTAMLKWPVKNAKQTSSKSITRVSSINKFFVRPYILFRL